MQHTHNVAVSAANQVVPMFCIYNRHAVQKEMWVVILGTIGLCCCANGVNNGRAKKMIVTKPR